MDWFYGTKLLWASGLQKMAGIGYAAFLLSLIASLISSLLMTKLYFKFHKSRAVGSTIYRAFAMLGVTITSIFISLQFSIPISLGLLGALSIIRFRTPIKDPEEVGLILLIIAIAMCCATFNLTFLVMVLLVAFIGLLILSKDTKFFKNKVSQGFIIVNLDIKDFHEFSSKILNQLSLNVKGGVDSVLENLDDGAISYAFTELDADKFEELKSKIQQYSNSIRVNVFFNNPGIFQ